MAFQDQKNIKKPIRKSGRNVVHDVMVACQVVQQEMDVEVVLMSRLWIICISQVSTTTRNVKQEFPEISSPLSSHKSFTHASLASPGMR